jgi:hypothetical protein
MKKDVLKKCLITLLPGWECRRKKAFPGYLLAISRAPHEK